MDTQTRAELIESLMKEIKKETKKINDNINEKHKKLETKLASVEKKLVSVEIKLASVEQTAKKALDPADVNQNDISHTSKLLEEQQQEIISLKATLNEQIDRSLRSTLIFKGIPHENKEKSWDDTKNTLIKYLSTTFNWDKEVLSKDIERAHRGKINEENTKQNDAIYVKFESWRNSEGIKKDIIKANRDGHTKVIVTQMYSKVTTDIINDKLKLRKDIIQRNNSWKMYVKYPGILMAKKPGQSKFLCARRE